MKKVVIIPNYDYETALSGLEIALERLSKKRVNKAERDDAISFIKMAITRLTEREN